MSDVEREVRMGGSDVEADLKMETRNSKDELRRGGKEKCVSKTLTKLRKGM